MANRSDVRKFSYKKIFNKLSIMLFLNKIISFFKMNFIIFLEFGF